MRIKYSNYSEEELLKLEKEMAVKMANKLEKFDDYSLFKMVEYLYDKSLIENNVSGSSENNIPQINCKNPLIRESLAHYVRNNNIPFSNSGRISLRFNSADDFSKFVEQYKTDSLNYSNKQDVGEVGGSIALNKYLENITKSLQKREL